MLLSPLCNILVGTAFAQQLGRCGLKFLLDLREEHTSFRRCSSNTTDTYKSDPSVLGERVFMPTFKRAFWAMALKWMEMPLGNRI